MKLKNACGQGPLLGILLICRTHKIMAARGTGGNPLMVFIFARKGWQHAEAITQMMWGLFLCTTMGSQP